MITDAIEMKRIIKDCGEQSHIKKLDSLGDLDKFLDTHNLSRLNHKEIKNMNKPITGRGWNGNQKPPPLPKYPGQDGFTGEFYQTFN